MPQGIITTIAGIDPVFTGEGRRAEDVTLGTIRGVAIDRNGTVIFADEDFGLVLKLGRQPGNEPAVASGVCWRSRDGMA